MTSNSEKIEEIEPTFDETDARSSGSAQACCEAAYVVRYKGASRLAPPAGVLRRWFKRDPAGGLLIAFSEGYISKGRELGLKVDMAVIQRRLNRVGINFTLPVPD